MNQLRNYPGWKLPIILAFCQTLQNISRKQVNYVRTLRTTVNSENILHNNIIIQGVPQYCLHFCFVNFSASKAPRGSILNIFQQPFTCRFRNFQICYYLVQFWPRYCQNTERKSLGPMAPQSWMLIGTHECCWGHGTMLRRVYGCLWVLMRAYECSRVPKSAH